MNAAFEQDHTLLDRPEVCRALFHPRGEWSDLAETDQDHMIPVAQDVAIGARFHVASPSAVNILFFHGNGEIVADYHDLGPLYNRMDINFLVADYRGYGRSSGTPTVSAMLADSHRILEYARAWLAENRCTGPLVVMGRSLGSAPALELAAAHGHAVSGLIIESGFALAAPLLRLLGVDVVRLGFEERKGFRNTDKMGRFTGPTLLIHAEHDHIIPFADGEALFAASGAPDKRLVRIDGANHNDLFYVGAQTYLKAVADLVRKVRKWA